jgi:dTDP-4-dehydrorhamnose reductase
MKIMIVGSRGLLGSDLMAVLAPGNLLTGLDKAEIDITDLAQCEAWSARECPEVIINAAALAQVDYCQSHEAEANLVNGEGAGNLATAAAAVGSTILQYSTDYIFDGVKQEPYEEDDDPCPKSAYGRSKLLGEDLVRQNCPNHLILRTSWMFGRSGNNFISTILAAARSGKPLRVVNDQRGSPTYSRDLAIDSRKLLEARCRGTYHVTNSGFCTWYDLARYAVEGAGISGVEITPVSTTEFPRPAPRPANSVLANARLIKEGLPRMRPWQDAVRDYLSYI